MITTRKIFSKYPVQIKTFGNSMYPLLHDGDILSIKKVTFNKVKTNDIICVKKKKELFTHRVIYVSSNYVITKGDNNTFTDGKAYQKNILGKVYRIKRGRKTFTPEDIYLIQSTTYFKELSKVIKRLEDRKIDSIILKGLPLHLHFTGSHPNRLYGDCDILIKKRDRKKLAETLKELGYIEENAQSYKKFQKYIGADEKEVTYFKYSNHFPIILDIHFELAMFTHKAKLPFGYLQRVNDEFEKKIYKSLQTIDVGGEKFTILENNLLIIYLLMHFYSHNFTEIYRLEFVNTILNKCQKDNRLNWKEIILTARELRVLNFITPSLFIIEKYYGHKIYSDIKRQYKGKINYAMTIFKIICGENKVFESERSRNEERLRRATLMVLLSEESLLTKSVLLFQPSLILHAVQFMFKLRR